MTLLPLSEEQIARIKETMRDRWYMLVDAERIDTLVEETMELITQELLK